MKPEEQVPDWLFLAFILALLLIYLATSYIVDYFPMPMIMAYPFVALTAYFAIAGAMILFGCIRERIGRSK